MVVNIRFDGQTVVVTGAGGGLGKAYALFFAERGASVVVHDLGRSVKGVGVDRKAADLVVYEITRSGGRAVASYESVENGEKIIQTAIDAFGRIDILINNAGILRDISFKNIKDIDWDLVTAVHLDGAFKCTRAAWPHFRKQKYGRVINTSSVAGLFGSSGQTNYSAVKAALVGFTKTLAREGSKYNILCNVIAPIFASRMSETIMSPELLAQLKPDWIVPVVAVLSHSSNTQETGSIFEVGAGHVSKYIWERSKGLLLKADENLTAGAILQRWSELNDFSGAEPSDGPADMVAMLDKSRVFAGNRPTDAIRFDGKVVLVTGAGSGIGRAYALAFAKQGASVAVNDIRNADIVVDEIKKTGGRAIGIQASVEEGESVVQAVISAYGRIDVIINNGGIVRDKGFGNMTDQQWNDVIKVHLRAAYSISKAAYPHMLKQKFGRIINTTSPSGIYGNFGQANYSAAKAGLIGFTRALALEGRKNNILVNAIAPFAGTQMSKNVLESEVYNALKPDYIVPLVQLLVSDKVPEATGLLFEVGSGWQARTRWRRSEGYSFPQGSALTPEDVLEKWPLIVDFNNGRADNPENAQDGLKLVLANTQNKPGNSSTSKKDYLSIIEAAKNARSVGTQVSYTERDVILYNLSLNATKDQLSLVYENDNNFQALPTFGVIPQFGAEKPFTESELVPNYAPTKLLHGEQYLEIRKFPIPTAARTKSCLRLVEVVDKGNAAIIVTGTTTTDAETGEDLFYNEATVFARGSGGFGGPKQGGNRGNATTMYNTPNRAPDLIVEEKTTTDQAVLYRLNGDKNPLHIDPVFARDGGWPQPILHGLCTCGLNAKHIVQNFGQFKDLKVRFVGVVLPGQTILTEMWKESRKIIFQCRVKESGKLTITGGVSLVDHQRGKL